jgi:Fur family ferric uptake transcriptional regulator
MIDTNASELVIEKLRNHGCRITNQRRILIDIILENDCASCKEIYYLASKKDPDIGMATVYRMMRTLEEFGIISRNSMYQIKI